jgi:hypothetical protein
MCIFFGGTTARGGPWPPLQYASNSLDPLLCHKFVWEAIIISLIWDTIEQVDTILTIMVVCIQIARTE